MSDTEIELKINIVAKKVVARLFHVVALFAHLVAVAAPQLMTGVSRFRPLAVAGETAAELARYSLRAYANCDATNSVKALLFTPKLND